jgi:hypothetical protein
MRAAWSTPEDPRQESHGLLTDAGKQWSAASVNTWTGIIGAISGVVAGWVLAQIAKSIDDRARTDRELKASAFVCLDRLLRIQSAAGRHDTKQTEDEIFHLGKDMDRYRESMAAATARSRRVHWPVYRSMMTVLLEHNTDGIDQTIAKLGEFQGHD